MGKINWFLRLMIVGLLLAACSGQQPPKETTKPNVLFILADDLGWTDVSYNGSKFYETPNIDQIAAEGTIFTNGYASAQVCSPSHASIMTGQNPARHGITDWIGAKADTSWRSRGQFNRLLPAQYKRYLALEDTTLAEAFAANGYRTFFAGKWHLGGEKEGSLPQNHGFQINRGGWRKGSPHGGYFSPWKNPSLENRYAGENLSMRLAEETAAFIKQNHLDSAGRPFLAFLSFYAVHTPLQTSEKKWNKYRNKAEQMGLAQAQEVFIEDKRKIMRQWQDDPVYAGLVESMDDAVGYVLQVLDSLGLDENTIVVFTSDNGGLAFS